MASNEGPSALTYTGIFGIIAALLFTLPRSSSEPAKASTLTSSDSARLRSRMSQVSLSEYDELIQWIRRETNRHVNTLLLMLPDPLDSRSDWGFDTELDAARRAFEQASYVLDRFYIPWSHDQAARALGIPLHLHEQYPGLLYFRGNTVGDNWVVLVIGEKPTSGINTGQMATALKSMDELGGEHQAIRIVGPAFSGSAHSLRQVLDTHGVHGHGKVVIESGSATSRDNLDSLDVPGLHYRFRAAVHADDDLVAVRNGALGQLGFREDEVALLVEGSTGWGLDQLRSDEHHFSIRVPLGIASLRAEYQRTQQRASNNDQATPRRTPFDLSLRDPDSPHESPPIFSGLTPPVLEEQLDEIAGTLRHQRIRAVGIFATDVRDKLFLARELGHRIRGITLFTDESNLLYLWPDYLDVMRGMLVFTTYPLIADTRTLSSRARGVLPFASEGAQGIFNAVLIQLHRDSLVEMYEAPYEANSTRPPVWITAVGRDGFVPLTFVTTASDRQYVDDAYRPPFRNDGLRPTPPRIPVWAVVAFALGVTGLLLSLRPTTPKLDRRAADLRKWAGWTSGPKDLTESQDVPGTAPLSAADAAERESRRSAEFTSDINRASLVLHWHLYTWIHGVALIGVLGPVALFIWARFTAESSPYLLLFLVAVWPAIGALRGLFGHVQQLARDSKAGVRYFFGLGKSPQPRRKWLWRAEVSCRLLLYALSLAYAAALVVLFWELGALQDPERALFVHRVAHPASGLSPLVPVAIGSLGLVVWSFWHLERVFMLSQATPFESWGLAATKGDFTAPIDEPDLNPDGTASRLGGLQRRIVNLRNGFFLLAPGSWSVVFLVVVLAFTAWIFQSIRPPYETLALPDKAGFLFPTSQWLYFLYSFIGAASLAIVFWGAYRLVQIWLALRELLDRLGGSPLLPAFSRLPERVSSLAHLSLLGMRERLNVEDLARVQWGQLARLYPSLARAAATAPGSASEATRLLAWLIEGTKPAVPTEKTALAADVHSRFKDAVAKPMPPLRTETLAVVGPDGSTFNAVFSALEGTWGDAPLGDVAEFAEHALSDPKSDNLHENTTSLLLRGVSGPARLWVRGVEEFVALHIVHYLSWIVALIRRLATFLVLTLICATILITSNPAYNSKIVQSMFFAGLMSTVGALVWILIGMNRDEVLSRVNRTEPGKVTWDAKFVINLLTFGAVPAIALLSAVFPTVSDFLFKWVTPFLHGHGG